jgi:quercetin dioxygenase-like cupin family protein
MEGTLEARATPSGAMKHRAAIIAALVIGMASSVLNAQQTPPTQRKGQTIKVLASLELSGQIPELQGRYLRARMFTYEPGGNGLLHNHRTLPVILYVLNGTLTTCSPDGKCVEISEGQAHAEGKDVVHWAENRGTRPVSYLAVEIGKEP